MDSRQLRYFVAVCTWRNLSHAADHCNTAASALSHHIARLEEELETPLFIRKPRGMEPTAAGLRLLTHAKGILDAFDQAAQDVRTGQAEISGSIAIGMPFSVVNVIGGALMRVVIEDLPKVRLLIREGLSGMTYRALRDGEVASALIFNPPPDSLTQRVALLEEELFCIGRREVIGDPSEPLRLEDMADLPLAMLQSGSLSRALIDRPAELARLEANARVQLASVAGTLRVLKEGIGCTLAPKVLVSEDLAKGDLVARRIVEPVPIRTLYLVSASEQRPSFLSERIAALICDKVTEAVEAGRWEGARLLR